MSTRTKSKRGTTPSSSTTPNGRLFNDSDEIRLLKTYHRITHSTPPPPSSSSSSPSSTITVDPQTFERINKALSSKFTHSQITDKLRRLRTKYHKLARTKSLIRTPHDQKFYNLARKIWGKKPKPKDQKVQDSAPSDDEDEELPVVAGNKQEREEVDLKEYPVLVSEFSKYLPVNSVWREGLKLLGTEKLREMNEQWMSIGIEETKIATKKAELVKEQTQLVSQVFENGTEN